MSNLDTKNKLDTRYIIYLDLIKDIKNKVMDFNLSDVETNDFFYRTIRQRKVFI